MSKRAVPEDAADNAGLVAKRPRLGEGGDLLARLDAVSLGIKEGQSSVQMPGIVYDEKKTPQIPAGDGWERNPNTGALIAGQEELQPFNPIVQADVTQRLDTILAHRDYRFAALFSQLVNLPTTAVIRTGALRTQLMQEENLRQTKKLENERLALQADKKTKELAEYKKIVAELQQEEVLIHNQVIRPARELDDVAGLAAWRRPIGTNRVYETCYWPAYMAWQYEWLRAKLGKATITDPADAASKQVISADDLAAVKHILAMDKRIYTMAALVDAIGGYGAVATIDDKTTVFDATWRVAIYVIQRDIIHRKDLPPIANGVADLDRCDLGRLLSDVLLYALWQGLQSLPGIASWDIEAALPTPDELLATNVFFADVVMDVMVAPKESKKLKEMVALFTVIPPLYTESLLPLSDQLDAAGANFATATVVTPAQFRRLDGGILETAGTVSKAGLQFTNLGDVFTDAVVAGNVRKFLLEGILWDKQAKNAISPYHYRRNFPSLLDYKNARIAVTAFLSPAVFRFADALAANPDNVDTPEKATVAPPPPPPAKEGGAADAKGEVASPLPRPRATPLFYLRRMVGVDPPNTDKYRSNTRRQFFYHSLVPGTRGRAAVGDLQDSITYGKIALPPHDNSVVYMPPDAVNWLEEMQKNTNMKRYTPTAWKADEFMALFSGTANVDLDSANRNRISSDVMARVVLPGLEGGMSTAMMDVLTAAPPLFDATAEQWTFPFEISQAIEPVLLRYLVGTDVTALPDVGNVALMQRSWPLSVLSLIVDLLLTEFSAAAATRQRRLKEFLQSIGEIEQRLHQLQREAASDHLQVSKIMQREYIHEAAYIQQPLITGRIYFDDMFTTMLALAHSDVRIKFGYPAVALDDLTNLDARPDLAVAFAQYMAALHLGVRLGHTSQYHKDLEWKAKPTIMVDAITRLRQALEQFGRGRGGGGGLLRANATGKFIF